MSHQTTAEYCPQLIKIDKVADLLQVSERQVRYLANSNSASYDERFPIPLRIRGSIRFRLDELTRYIEQLQEMSK